MKRLLIAVITALLIATTANAGMLDALFTGHRMAAGDIGHGSQTVYINYCVQSDGFNTGIRITPDSRVPIKFYVFFFNNATPYDWKTISIGPKGWTGLISELLTPGVFFRSPSNVLIITSNTATDPRFWVDQFIISPSGFGFVQLESKSEL